jgi:hypothetical protein
MIIYHASIARSVTKGSGKARGWWREIGQRARPPTEAACPRSLQPGTGLTTEKIRAFVDNIRDKKDRDIEGEVMKKDDDDG